MAVVVDRLEADQSVGGGAYQRLVALHDDGSAGAHHLVHPRLGPVGRLANIDSGRPSAWRL